MSVVVIESIFIEEITEVIRTINGRVAHTERYIHSQRKPHTHTLELGLYRDRDRPVGFRNRSLSLWESVA